MTAARPPYPTDVSDEEWAFVAPYLALLPEHALQRRHSLREVFNGLRYLVYTGAPWRLLPHDACGVAALADRVPADPPVDRRWRVRGDRA